VALRIVVIEDHELLRTAVVDALSDADDLEVVADVATAASGLQAIIRHQPDVVVLDHHLPDETGARARPAILRAKPAPRVVVWTASPAASALRGFAEDPRVRIVGKDHGLADVFTAIRELGPR
jgi:DNA-binding NarL/FixJ family response regulator